MMTLPDLKQKLKLIFVPSEANNFRPKFLTSRVLLWCLLALFILKIITIPFLIYFQKSIFFSDISKSVLIALLNKDRQSAGLQSLKENATLNNAATMKAQDILAKDYFSHQSPEGISPWYWFKAAGYNYQVAGENLAIGFLDSEEVNQAWLDSPSHRANLLNANYKDVGIAILTGDFDGNETTVVVQLFGALQPATAGPKVQTKEQAPKETAKPAAENTEKEVAGKQTLSSMAKEVAPALKEAKEKALFQFFFFFGFGLFQSDSNNNLRIFGFDYSGFDD